MFAHEKIRIEAMERALAEETTRADKFGETLEQAYDLMDERKWGEAMELVSRVMHYPRAALSHPPVDTPQVCTCGHLMVEHESCQGQCKKTQCKCDSMCLSDRPPVDTEGALELLRVAYEAHAYSIKHGPDAEGLAHAKVERNGKTKYWSEAVKEFLALQALKDHPPQANSEVKP